MKNKGFFDDEVLPVIEDPELEALKQKLNELGIDMFPCFDGDTYDIDNDIEMARDCIYSGREVPDDARKRLLERKKNLKIPESRLLYRNIKDGEY